MVCLEFEPWAAERQARRNHRATAAAPFKSTFNTQFPCMIKLYTPRRLWLVLCYKAVTAKK